MLRGNYAAKIDDKGRLKVPNAFRALVEGKHGSELFVTSLTGESVLIYPMPIWLTLEEKLARVPTTHPARIKYFDRVNYYGQGAEFDTQGRVLIHPRLRESAGMAGEVDVFGQKSSRGLLVITQVLNGNAAYRTQLFLYLKACGREELGTLRHDEGSA